jgi:hypothetical protein
MVAALGTFEEGASRWRALVLGAPLTPEQRRRRLHRHGVVALAGVALSLVGQLLIVAIPQGSGVSGVAVALVGIGGACVVVAGLGVTAPFAPVPRSRS